MIATLAFDGLSIYCKLRIIIFWHIYTNANFTELLKLSEMVCEKQILPTSYSQWQSSKEIFPCNVFKYWSSTWYKIDEGLNNGKAKVARWLLETAQSITLNPP